MQNQNKVISPHGGYENLKSYQNAEIVCDFTFHFCNKYIDRRSRTNDQMNQAARSGKQNIAEGSMASGTSKKTELKLTGVARASSEELLIDYKDFLRQRGMALWTKDDLRVKKLRSLVYEKNRSYRTYKTYMENPEDAANCAICLIHQINFLLDQQLRALEQEFLDKGGFTERLYHARKNSRKI